MPNHTPTACDGTCAVCTCGARSAPASTTAPGLTGPQVVRGPVVVREPRR